MLLLLFYSFFLNKKEIPITEVHKITYTLNLLEIPIIDKKVKQPLKQLTALDFNLCVIKRGSDYVFDTFRDALPKLTKGNLLFTEGQFTNITLPTKNGYQGLDVSTNIVDFRNKKFLNIKFRIEVNKKTGVVSVVPTSNYWGKAYKFTTFDFNNNKNVNYYTIIESPIHKVLEQKSSWYINK